MSRITTYRPAKTLTIMVCLLASFIAKSSCAQVLPKLQENFNAYQSGNLQEKLYVHTDKNFYVTGEILWFKIYCVEGGTNKPLDVSKVAYVEVIDEDHNPVLQARVELKDGMGKGSFVLPFAVANGNYRLRAYTNWMKNFDADLYFQKPIIIVNPVKMGDVVPAKVTVDHDVQFFPEGGHLVKGLESRIAFKITAPNGKGEPATGAIIDQKNDTVVRFQTLKFGMGSFMFTPSSQSGYRAVIKTGGQTLRKDLPEISATGYVINATETAIGWDLTVSSRGETAGEVYVIVHDHSHVAIAEKGSLVNGADHFDVTRAKLNDGINYITLFDAAQHPLCDRMIFKHPQKNLLITAQADAASYGSRKKVDIAISTTSQDHKNIPASLSVSVYRLDSLQKDDAAHIRACLWLNSDLKGYIESPDYYLDNATEESKLALNNLLLTQGWSQFDWNTISAGQVPQFKYLPEYTGPIISGNVVNTTNNQPAGNITTYLTVAGAYHQLYLAKSDSASKLLFNTKPFYGQNELVAQTNWTQDSTYRIDIASPFSEQYGHQQQPNFSLNPASISELTNNSVNMQVQNIFATKQQKLFELPVADSGLFYQKPDYSYKLDDYTRFPTMEEVVHEYVRFVLITRDHGRQGFEVVHNKVPLPGHPLAMLDGRPIFDLNRFFLMDPLKIKRLDVITGNYIYGQTVFNGVLSFYSYTGNSNTVEMDPRAVVLDYEGLQLQRKFYSPVYGTADQIYSTLPDFRNVLYWSPDISASKEGNCYFSFYTGDKAGRYIGVIEGLSKDGEAGSQRFYFEVKK